MRVDDIRPEELVKENYRLYVKDVEWLMERRNEFVIVACPACGDDQGFPLIPEFVKDGFAHRRCVKCGTLFISPRPTRAMLLDYYKNAESIRHWGKCLHPATEDYRRSRIDLPRAAAVSADCLEYGIPRGTLVDLGAGFGTFAELARRHFFHRVVAVEPSPPLAASCRARGLEVLEATAEELHIDGANVVTAFELIEHLFDPRDLVDAVKRALVPCGLLILTTPDVEGFDLATLGALSDNIGGPNHLQFFTAAGMRVLLEGAGFEVLEVTTPGKLDAELVRAKALSGELDLSHQPFLREVLVDRWDDLGAPFQRFLEDNGLSSHMRVVALRR